MKRRIRLASVAFVLPIFLAALAARAQDRKPSTPEARANAVALTGYLEREPLGEKAKDARSALVVWWAQVPDLSVTLCGDLLGPLLGSKHKYEAELITQLAFSAGAYIIEHPGTSGESVDAYLAGVEGSLRAYEALLALKPKARHAFLDELLSKRAAGTLRQYVIDTVPKCKAPAAA